MSKSRHPHKPFSTKIPRSCSVFLMALSLSQRLKSPVVDGRGILGFLRGGVFRSVIPCDFLFHCRIVLYLCSILLVWRLWRGFIRMMRGGRMSTLGLNGLMIFMVDLVVRRDGKRLVESSSTLRMLKTSTFWSLVQPLPNPPS